MSDPDIQFPQVNLNGTSKAELANQYLDTYRALSATIDLLCKGYPHGRDYQTLPAGSYERARREHEIRIAKLVSIKEELEAIVMHIQD